MDKSIKGTKTEENLLKAFAGESQAKNRYQFFARQAQKDGYEQIAAIFNETAMNEHTHAKIFFKFLEGGMVKITASYPAGMIADTMTNLKEAAGGEHEEWTELYPAFAKVAEKEGFPKIATAFKLIATIEESHYKRFTHLLKNMQDGKVFEKNDKVVWYCRECGHLHFGKKALNKCPVCGHPMAFFEVKAENF